MEPITRRVYEGAFNNRIDRNEAVGSRFKVEGMRDHVLDADCFVEEDTVVERFRPRLQTVNDGGANPTIANYDSYFNLCMFRNCLYPRGLPPPRDNNHAVDPYYVSGDTYRINMERWALNKSFDNVTWFTGRSVNTHKCEVFDTCELQPWLSHKDCEHDIRRDDLITSVDFTWFNENTNTEVSEPNIPNCIFKPAYKDRFGIGVTPTAAGAVNNHHVFGAAFDEAVGADRATIRLLSHTIIPNASVLEWVDAEKRYEGQIIINAIANAFAGFNNFWVGKHSMILQGNGEYLRANLVATVLRVRITTTRPQSDGFCYRGSLLPALNNVAIAHNASVPKRAWYEVEAFVGAAWVLTDIVIAVPMFRIALASTQIDLNVPDWNLNWAGIWTNNRVSPTNPMPLVDETQLAIPGTLGVGDVYDSNISKYHSHIQHHGVLGNRCVIEEPFAKIYYDAAAWAENFPNANAVLANLATFDHASRTFRLGGAHVSAWVIEFDMTTEMGAYLHHEWQTQVRLGAVGNRRAVPEWDTAHQGNFMKFMAKTDFNPAMNGLNAAAIGFWFPGCLRTDKLFDMTNLAVPYNTTAFDNKLYFQVDGADVHQRLQMRLNSVQASEDFFETHDNEITEVGVNANILNYWNTIEYDVEVPTVQNQGLGGDYADATLFPQPLVVNAGGAGLVLQDWDGTDNRYWSLATIQPDPTKVTRPIIPTQFSFKLYEPFFSLGSAKGMFPLIRPFDVPSGDFPLLIQDYRIDFQRRYDRGFMLNSWFEALETMNVLYGHPDETHNFYPGEFVDNYLTTKVKQGKLNLITYSKDYGQQSQKGVSTIEKYVPKLVVHATGFVDIDSNQITQNIYMSRGFPSYFFIRLEYNNRGYNRHLASDLNNTLAATRVIRPSIASIVIRLFGQENTFVSKLTERELYQLCRKNCHKYCGFKDLWDNENALLLKLEDFGLWKESQGYPYRKRFELELRVTWTYPNEGYVAKAVNIGRKVQLRTVAIYESHFVRGDIRRIEFIETM